MAGDYSGNQEDNKTTARQLAGTRATCEAARNGGGSMAPANDPKPERGDDPIFGRIEAGVAYHKSQLIRRLGISDKTYRRLVRNGLPTCQIGAFVWILGDDLLEFIQGRRR